jgi:hypothetical protein
VSNYGSTLQFLQSQASRAMQQAENTRNRIDGGRAVSVGNHRVRTQITKPNIGPPPKFSDLFGVGDNTSAEIAKLNAEADRWLNQYFPSINACLRNVPEQWLCDIISGVRPFGQSKTYFELVWHEARDRAARTRRSEVRGIEQDFQARGFTLPPGAMVDAMTQARIRESDTVLEVNREQAIKDADIKLDLLKFAEEQALNYKLGVMNAMARLYVEWFRAPDRDVERARVRAQAYSAMYSALSTYYNVEVAFAQLALRRDEADANSQLGSDRNKISASTNTVVPSSLAQAVQGFTSVAAGASAAAGTLSADIITG